MRHHRLLRLCRTVSLLGHHSTGPNRRRTRLPAPSGESRRHCPLRPVFLATSQLLLLPNHSHLVPQAAATLICLLPSATRRRSIAASLRPSSAGRLSSSSRRRRPLVRPHPLTSLSASSASSLWHTAVRRSPSPATARCRCAMARLGRLQPRQCPARAVPWPPARPP